MNLGKVGYCILMINVVLVVAILVCLPMRGNTQNSKRLELIGTGDYYLNKSIENKFAIQYNQSYAAIAIACYLRANLEEK